MRVKLRQHGFVYSLRTASFLSWKEAVLTDRLAANAIPGPVSRRPANGAAAEIARRLHLPPAAAARNSQERRPEDVSSGLLAESGSPRAEQGSPQKQFRVSAGPAFRCRCIVLLTKCLPRPSPRLAVNNPGSGASSSQAPYRLASSQARKLTHSAARPLKIKAAALILERKTEGVDA